VNEFCRTIACQVIKVLESKEVPWQRPWVGCSTHIGYPTNIRTKAKFSGMNFVLLQLASKKHKFTSKFWAEQFELDLLGHAICSRPNHVLPGEWCTQGVLYHNHDITPIRLYNIEQCRGNNKPSLKLMPDYSLADRVLHSTGADVRFTEDNTSFYYYSPKDYIIMPSKEAFNNSLGRLPAYYDTLAHELLHWTEERLGYDAAEPEKELRAEIGAAILAEELHFPHNILHSNFDKWRLPWIEMIRNDLMTLFVAAEGAHEGVKYILGSQL